MSHLHEFRSFAFATIRSSFFCHFSVFLKDHLSFFPIILFRNILTRSIAYLEMWLTQTAHMHTPWSKRHTQIHKTKHNFLFQLLFLKWKIKSNTFIDLIPYHQHTIRFAIQFIFELYFSRSCSYHIFYTSSPCIRLTAIIAIATCIALNNMFKMAFLRNIPLPETISNNNNRKVVINFLFDTFVEIVGQLYDCKTTNHTCILFVFSASKRSLSNQLAASYLWKHQLEVASKSQLESLLHSKSNELHVLCIVFLDWDYTKRYSFCHHIKKFMNLKKKSFDPAENWTFYTWRYVLLAAWIGERNLINTQCDKNG